MAWGGKPGHGVLLVDDLESSTRYQLAISRIGYFHDRSALLTKAATARANPRRSVRRPAAAWPVDHPDHPAAALHRGGRPIHRPAQRPTSLVRELEACCTTRPARPCWLRRLPAGMADHCCSRANTSSSCCADGCRTPRPFAPCLAWHQHLSTDLRRIPFAIADLAPAAPQPWSPLMACVRSAQQRCHFSDLASLLDVPAVARRLVR